MGHTGDKQTCIQHSAEAKQILPSRNAGNTEAAQKINSHHDAALQACKMYKNPVLYSQGGLFHHRVTPPSRSGPSLSPIREQFFRLSLSPD